MTWDHMDIIMNMWFIYDESRAFLDGSDYPSIAGASYPNSYLPPFFTTTPQREAYKFMLYDSWAHNSNSINRFRYHDLPEPHAHHDPVHQVVQDTDQQLSVSS